MIVLAAFPTAALAIATATRAPSEEVCLVGNATDACMAVALRWAKLLAAERRRGARAQSRLPPQFFLREPAAARPTGPPETPGSR